LGRSALRRSPPARTAAREAVGARPCERRQHDSLRRRLVHGPHARPGASLALRANERLLVLLPALPRAAPGGALALQHLWRTARFPPQGGGRALPAGAQLLLPPRAERRGSRHYRGTPGGPAPGGSRRRRARPARRRHAALRDRGELRARARSAARPARLVPVLPLPAHALSARRGGRARGVPLPPGPRRGRDLLDDAFRRGRPGLAELGRRVAA